MNFFNVLRSLHIYTCVLLCLESVGRLQVEAVPIPRKANRNIASQSRSTKQRLRVQRLHGSNAKIWKFMKKYGYLPEEITESQFDEKLSKGELQSEISRVQDFMGFNPTGEIDDSTIERMNLPRCGFPDLTTNLLQLHEDNAERVKRFTLDGGRWEQSTITYKIINTSKDIPLDETTSVIRRSFDVWQEHIPKVFQEVESGPADISILFATFDHGDDVVFDGPGGTLAHAYGPQSVTGDSAGDIHLDDSENFVSSGTNGTSLFWVASHEIGHSLGLGHSNIAGSLMWPYYGQFAWRGILNYDDKLGIQKLYVDGGISVVDSSPSLSSIDSSEWSYIGSSFSISSGGSSETYESLVPSKSASSSSPSSQVSSTSSEPSSQVPLTSSEPSLSGSLSESSSSFWLSLLLSIYLTETLPSLKDTSEYPSETFRDETSLLPSSEGTSEISVSSVSSQESSLPQKSPCKSPSSSSSQSSEEIRKHRRLPNHRQHHFRHHFGRRHHRHNQAHYVPRRPHRFND